MTLIHVLVIMLFIISSIGLGVFLDRQYLKHCEKAQLKLQSLSKGIQLTNTINGPSANEPISTLQLIPCHFLDDEDSCQGTAIMRCDKCGIHKGNPCPSGHNY